MVRDTVLAASGLLSLKIGGPSVFPPQPDGIWDIPYSRREMDAERGRGSIPPRALRVHPALGAVSQLPDVRRDQPRALHGPARAHQHAAPGAHHAERRSVFRGGAGRWPRGCCARAASAPIVSRDAPRLMRFAWSPRARPNRTSSSESWRRTRSSWSDSSKDPDGGRHGRSRATRSRAIDAGGTGRLDARRQRAAEPGRVFTKQ